MTPTVACARLVVSVVLAIGISPLSAIAGPPPSPVVPTASPTPTASLVPTPTFGLNHFQCYEVHSRPNPERTVSLDDQFGVSTARVRQVHRICNPANKNGEDPSAATDRDHLVGYTIRQTSPGFRVLRDVEVVNQFGSIHVDVTRPEYLLVPSAKDLSAPPPLPAAFGVDHFKCYRVKHGRFRRAGVSVVDQFGSMVVDVKRPRKLCVPADKNGEGLRNPADHLLCYQVRLAKSSPPFTPAGRLFIHNQFGVDVLEGFRPTELCVPSLKIVPGGCSVQRGVAPVCGGSCPNPSDRCLFLSGPDMGGPDMGGPDMGGPEMSGPDPVRATCACRPLTTACGPGPDGVCGGLCPRPTDDCLFFSGPDMGGPDMGGVDMGGPEMSGPDPACACRPRTEACAAGPHGICGGLCPSPTDLCLFLSGPDMGGPDLGGPDVSGPEACACVPSVSACAKQSPGICGGFCPQPRDRCLLMSGPDLGGPDMGGPDDTCSCARPLP